MKKIISTLLCLVFIVSATANVFADTDESLNDEVITLIVELEGDAVLESDAAKAMGVDYLDTYKGRRDESKIEKKQEEVIDEIEKTVDADITLGYNYTTLFNGFSLDAPRELKDDIKNIDGVKAVYESMDMQLKVPSAAEMTNSLPEDTANIGEDLDGYTGKGQAVAIIDSEFQLDHLFFYPRITDGLIDKEKAEKVRKETYYNSKIPFRYDYGEGDTETKLSDYYYNENGTNAHGTHVAGIAAGINLGGFFALTPEEGVTVPSTMAGVAPDAQLVLMKVSNSQGKAETHTVLAAMDDAVKLKVCAINLSLGITYATPELYEVYLERINNAIEAGIVVSASAGNEGIGYSSTEISADKPDYGTSSVPALNSKAISVAAANNRYVVNFDDNTYNKYDVNGQISEFSSWGTNDSLELKPEITAPGKQILSSIPNNTSTGVLGYMSGTSMSAPHITGVVALINEFFTEKEIKWAGQAKVQRIENLLMSAADIIKQEENNVPFSPRVQGAGLVNTAAAMKTPVIIIGDNGKTKLSLKEIGKTFELNFVLQNLSDEDVTYDTITLDVIADEASDGVITGKSRALKYACELPEIVVVPAGEAVEFIRTVTLDDDELADRLLTFTNGFFVDGFVSFENNTDPEISIPFTGFYGDWTEATVFDKTMYDEVGSEVINTQSNLKINGTYLYTYDGDVLEANGKIGNKYDKSRIAISPDGDARGDLLGIRISPLRSIKTLTYTLTNNSDTAISDSGAESNILKYRGQDIDLFTDIKDLPDGEYTLKFEGTYPYDGDVPDRFELPIVIDTEIPEITAVLVSDNNVTLYAKDTNYINDINMYYSDTAVTRALSLSKKGQTAVESFDIPDGTDPNTVYFEITDNAYNTSKLWLKNIGNIAGYLNSYKGSETATAAKINLINTKELSDYCSVIIVYYDSFGRMIAVDKQDNITLDVNKNTLITSNIDEDTRTAK